jgi:hypothetical protein
MKEKRKQIEQRMKISKVDIHKERENTISKPDYNKLLLKPDDKLELMKQKKENTKKSQIIDRRMQENDSQWCTQHNALESQLLDDKQSHSNNPILFLATTFNKYQPKSGIFQRKSSFSWRNGRKVSFRCKTRKDFAVLQRK